MSRPPRVLGRSISSSRTEEFSYLCDRCGVTLKTKGGRGDRYGVQMCKDCTHADHTFRLLASGRKRFEDLKHEVAS